MPEPEKQNQLWLEKSGLDTVLSRYHNLGCIGPGILIPCAVALLIATGFGGWWLAIASVIFATMTFALHRYSKHLFYHRLVCPKCGFNPTRRKSDGKPRKDTDKVIAQMKRYTDCPNCGTDESDS